MLPTEVSTFVTRPFTTDTSVPYEFVPVLAPLAGV
jgi:hypothetical protein